MHTIRYMLCVVFAAVLLAACQTTTTETAAQNDEGWIPLITGDTLDGWTPHGSAQWRMENGVIIGQSPGGQGHLYALPVLTDLEVKGEFRITSQGRDANSGLYFRANPPAENPEDYPQGYEAQICNSQDAHTGWLWKPGSPTCKASELLTQDGEWCTVRVKALGNQITIWVNDVEVTSCQDDDYQTGHFALQCHNDGMTIEAKELYYRDLGNS